MFTLIRAAKFIAVSSKVSITFQVLVGIFPKQNCHVYIAILTLFCRPSLPTRFLPAVPLSNAHVCRALFTSGTFVGKIAKTCCI